MVKRKLADTLPKKEPVSSTFEMTELRFDQSRRNSLIRESS